MVHEPDGLAPGTISGNWGWGGGRGKMGGGSSRKKIQGGKEGRGNGELSTTKLRGG